MCLKPSTDLLQLEAWLNILIVTYKYHPSCGLAQTINYYLSRLLHHDDIDFCGQKRCDYLLMQKYWHWQANHLQLSH